MHKSKEWNKHAQAECANHPHPPECLFADIADFLLPSVKQRLSSMQQRGALATELEPLVLSNRAMKKTFGHH